LVIKQEMNGNNIDTLLKSYDLYTVYCLTDRADTNTSESKTTDIMFETESFLPFTQIVRFTILIYIMVDNSL